ncbi:MAG TPA: selenium metabolism-associated LysR family transcriptional regulator [Geobacteraceae bacterium]|nr:selenium metabolism-associated LysR family transcriptional regulator [Geobacteraceae bacterium]
MNLKQLEIFLAVAETGSFSRGAEATFITQSTASQHISSLESDFGVRLLDRTGRGALLTEGGKVLFQHARQVIDDVQAIHQAMRRFKGAEDVELRIGGSNIPANYMIPELLPVLLERFPTLRLTLIQGDSRDILEKLAREEIELGVVGSRFDEEGFEFAPLGRDEISLVVNRRHPWNGRKSVELAELEGEPLVLREPGSGTGRTVNEALAKAGLPPQTLKVTAHLGSNEAVKHAVASGLGSSFVSLLSVGKEIEREELVPVKVKGLTISRRFYLASRAGRELSPAAKAFAKVLGEKRK